MLFRDADRFGLLLQAQRYLLWKWIQIFLIAGRKITVCEHGWRRLSASVSYFLYSALELCHRMPPRVNVIRDRSSGVAYQLRDDDAGRVCPL